MKKERPKIYNMDLHEVIDGGYFRVLRVAGGWIYFSEETIIFVPFNNEFMNN